jgi:DNA polymerase IV
MPQTDCMRTLFHVDMDAFFVSVEELFNPELKGKAVVVGGARDERGVVSAASYEARKFGVHSAMPLRTAAKLCPHAIFVPGSPERYRDCSRKVYTVLKSFTPLVEMASIDEAYLDMSGTERLHGPSLRAADLLHARMKRDTGLNCSIGIAGSQVLAKVASDQAKPNGVFMALHGCESSVLAPLEVRKLPGVGKVTETKLHEIGIRTCGQLAALDDETARNVLGDWGVALAAKARGEDAGGWYSHDMGEESGPKSIGHEHTFGRDTRDQQQLEETLLRLSEMVASRLREQKLFARTIHLKLRTSDFVTITRARTLDSATHVDGEIFACARELFRANWRAGSLVRLLGITTTGFEDQPEQLDLLADPEHEKWEQALAVADKLRSKFGDDSVVLGAALKRKIREKTHENPHNLPGKE